LAVLTPLVRSSPDLVPFTHGCHQVDTCQFRRVDDAFRVHGRPRLIKLLTIFLPVVLLSIARAAPPPTNSLSHDVYVWQRAWTPAVRNAVITHAGTFERVIVLAAEVSWARTEPKVTRVAVDYPALAASKAQVGLALRIGPYPGPFSADDKTARLLSGLASNLVVEARAKGISPAELQIDFDCAESKLDGYRAWLAAIKQAVQPTKVILTALPVWLRQPAFPKLASLADGYVLQVHSLEPPTSPEAPFTLCNPAAANQAIERAASIGIPFRVALPTYGYLVAFATNGHFVGLSAEGPARAWPANAILKEVRTDPQAMAQLVEHWAANPPPALRGWIWYRFPVADDTLNWRWPTLSAIVHSHSLREQFHAEVRRVEPGLMDVSLVNDGELDISSRLAVEVHWQDARLVAGDGLQGVELVEANPSTARLLTPSIRLPAGEPRKIGWLRFSKDCEVTIECKKM
jgi:hypothetical protein